MIKAVLFKMWCIPSDCEVRECCFKNIFFSSVDLYGRGGNDYEKNWGPSLALGCKADLTSYLPIRKLTVSKKFRAKETLGDFF